MTKNYNLNLLQSLHVLFPDLANRIVLLPCFVTNCYMCTIHKVILFDWTHTLLKSTGFPPGRVNKAIFQWYHVGCSLDLCLAHSSIIIIIIIITHWFDITDLPYKISSCIYWEENLKKKNWNVGSYQYFHCILELLSLSNIQ